MASSASDEGLVEVARECEFVIAVVMGAGSGLLDILFCLDFTYDFLDAGNFFTGDFLSLVGDVCKGANVVAFGKVDEFLVPLTGDKCKGPTLEASSQRGLTFPNDLPAEDNGQSRIL